MIKIIFVILIPVLFYGCELIIIGTKSNVQIAEIVEYNQKTALGTIYLFKAELDSNNVPAASQLMKQSDGKSYLAIERYEKFYDIHRFRRIMAMSEITDISSEAISGDKMKYNLEFNFRKKLYFNALKVENNWYITEVGNND